MKSLLLISLILTSFSSLVLAQPIIEWENTIGGNFGDYAYSGIQTSEGGFVVVGKTNSGISGDQTEPPVGLNDIWVVKLNSFGIIEWQNTIGGSDYDYVESVIQTSDGGYFLFGSSQSNIGGDKTENSNGFTDYWVVKLDALGSIQWQNTIGGTGEDYLDSGIQSSDGGYVLAGRSESGIGGDKSEMSQGLVDYWVVKLDEFGNIIWENTIGGSDADFPFDIAEASDSGYVIVGTSSSGISGDKTDASFGFSDYWVVKLNYAGIIVWQETIGGASSDHLHSITATPDSGFFLGGYSASGVSGSKTEAAIGSFDYWVVKIDSVGTVEWQNTIGGTSFDALESSNITSDGGFIIGGRSESGIGGDRSEANVGVAADYWIVKLDAVGTVLWDKTIGGTTDDELFEVQQTSDNGYILTGNSNSDIGGNKSETTLGVRDFWIVKLTCDGTDIDQDGYCTSTDCNDNDSLVNPGMTEIQCNGIDDDCNPLTLDDDVTNPIAPVLADSISECSITLAVPTTTDNCAGTIIGTTSDPITYSSDGSYTVNWTFDDGNGNSIIVPQNVIIDDVTDPIQIVLADSLGQCSASIPVPSTTDNCGGTIVGTTTQPLTYNTQGQFIVYWVFDDGNGQLIVSPQTIIIEDTMAPDTPILPDLIGDCSVIAVAPMTSDNCAGAITGTTTDPLSYLIQGTYTINWTFDDGNGNSIVVPQNVIVDDVTDPIPPTLSDLIDECSVTAVTPTTTDNCAGTITGTTSTVFPITAQGTTIVTWSFDDGNGNVLTVDQNIIIADNTAPLADIASLPDVTSGCDITSLNPPTATDNCTGVVSVTNNAVFPITTGTTSITWTYEDQNGNTSSQMQNAIVSPMDITTSLDAGGVEITANNSSAAYQWIDCLNNNSPIISETNQTFTATYNGEFAVELTENGCIDTSSCTVVSQVDLIESSLLNSIKVYPNPTNGNLTIASDFNIDRLRVIDPQGRVIVSKLNLSDIEVLDLSRYDSGVYFLMIETVHGTEKFMVEKVD